MAEQHLDGAQIDAALDEVGGETVPERVAVDGPVETGHAAGGGDGPLQRPIEDVVPPAPAGSRAGRELPRRERELPFQGHGCLRILPLQGTGKFDASDAAVDIAVVQRPPAVEDDFQPGPGRPRQHHDAILVALAATDDELVAPQVDVVDAQPAAFHEPQSAAVEKLGHEPKRAAAALHPVENGPHFLRR